MTGIDPETTYIYLLEGANDRTAETWKKFIEDKKLQGLNLETSINDGAKGIIIGVTSAFPGILIQLDVFHALMGIGKRIIIIERQAYSKIAKEADLEKRVEVKGVHQKTKEELKKIRAEVEELVENYDTLNILFGWLRELLGFTGYRVEDTKALIEFVLCEIEKNANKNEELQKKVEGFRNNTEFLFTFMTRLQNEMEKHSKEKGIPLNAYEMMYEQLIYDEKSEEYQEIECKLVMMLKEDYERGREDFKKLLNSIKKASSIVENLNSRIRTYMNVKRMVPENFFTLMKVYFNTMRYRRSRIKERVGKSPLEILTGRKQPSFMEAIGF